MNELNPLLAAIAFAARAHRHQLRKDGVTPYASHPFRVAMTLALEFGVRDPETLMAAVLHDTIEDTTTDYDDLAKHFGKNVADWVAALTKDGSLPEAEREDRYRQKLAAAPPPVVLAKLGDICDNLTDSLALSEEHRRKTLATSEGYLAALRAKLTPETRPAFKIVQRKLESVRPAKV